MANLATLNALLMLPTSMLARRATLPLLLATLLAGCSSTEPDNPLPSLYSIDPSVLAAGSATGATITLTGSGFVSGSHARWNNADRPTTFVNNTHLTVQLTPQDVAGPGAGSFVVINPAPGGGTSAVVSLDIRPALPAGVTALYLANRPHGIAVANGVFYVSQIDGQSVTKGAVTATTQSITGTVALGASQPAHVALDPNATHAYTANQSGQSVSFVDVTNNTLIANLPILDHGYNVLTSPDGARVYVSTAEGHLYVIDTGTRNILATVNVGLGANGLAYDPQSSTLYVSSIQDGTITAINATTNSVVHTYQVSLGAQRIALSPDHSKLYIASESVGLEILDLSSGSHPAVAGLPNGAVGLALSPDGTKLVLTFPPTGTVDILDTGTLLVTKTLNLGTPRNAAFAANGAVVIVTDENGRLLFLR